MRRLTASISRFALALVPLASSLALSAAWGQGQPASLRPAHPSPIVESVRSVGMTVANMDRSIAFFSTVLTFEPVSDVTVTGADYDRLQGVFGVRMRIVRMKLGNETLELTEYLAPRGRPIPEDSRSHDRWFQHVAIIVSDMDAAYARLREHGVEHASPEPQRLPDWNPQAGGIRAFYFKDPDGHPLEILQFPPDKGDPKWRRTAGRLFLGIDHTAIVVDDTDRSLAFYRDTLGFRVAGQSTNYGIEQERLNNVVGARLHITGLKLASGLGLELLDYLTPTDGRPAADIRANDSAHWETTLASRAIDDGFARLLHDRALLVSPTVVALRGAGRTRGLMVRDPDGHAIKLVQ